MITDIFTLEDGTKILKPCYKCRRIDCVFSGTGKPNYDMVCNDYLPVKCCENCQYWQDNNVGFRVDGCKWRSDETPDADDYCSGFEELER